MHPKPADTGDVLDGAACSSSFYALHNAVQDIQRGTIDYALVGGSSAVLRPATSIAFDRLQCAPTGAPVCKCCDWRPSLSSK